MELDFAGFIVSALVGVLAWVAGEKAYRSTKQQNVLNASTIAADWLRDLRSWGGEAVDVLAEASYSCRRGDVTTTPEEHEILLRCRFRLSALIDRGRFLLPNEREQEYGDHKADAYKGLRHAALDALVAAERIVGGDADLCAFPDRKAALIGVRREFVSVVQGILDPRSANKALAKLLHDAHADRKRDPTLGGLLPDPTKVPSGAEGLLYAASMRHEHAQMEQSKPVAQLPNKR